MRGEFRTKDRARGPPPRAEGHIEPGRGEKPKTGNVSRTAQVER